MVIRYQFKTSLTFFVFSLEKQKSTLVEALVKKGTAIGDHFLCHFENEVGSSDLTASMMDTIYFDLVKIVGNGDAAIYENSKLVPFIERHARVRKDYGRLIKLYMKQLEAGNGLGGAKSWNVDSERKLIEALEQAQLKHAANLYQRNIHVRYPTSYRLF